MEDCLLNQTYNRSRHQNEIYRRRAQVSIKRLVFILGLILLSGDVEINLGPAVRMSEGICLTLFCTL